MSTTIGYFLAGSNPIGLARSEWIFVPSAAVIQTSSNVENDRCESSARFVSVTCRAPDPSTAETKTSVGIAGVWFVHAIVLPSPLMLISPTSTFSATFETLAVATSMLKTCS
jgi:hypothetical protein